MYEVFGVGRRQHHQIINYTPISTRLLSNCSETMVNQLDPIILAHFKFVGAAPGKPVCSFPQHKGLQHLTTVLIWYL